MSYCDACHDSDPFECGAELARVKRQQAADFLAAMPGDELPAASANRRAARRSNAFHFYGMAAELKECGCPCACHGGVVDGPATATTGGAS